MVKEFLSQRGVPYRDRDVSRDPAAAQELMTRTGQMAVPVIIIDGQTVIGFDQPRLEQLISARARQPTFGASVADALKTTGSPGAYVGRVRPGSAAERLGLAGGDIILEINQQRVNTSADLQNILSRLSQGSRLSMVFSRKGQVLHAEGTL
ncbi:MAG: PDZ domain-containing protein [Dehalococcoidales bacterium]|nr:PDZ domain-containing protein [Dehalococcoidales bacterium]